MAPLPTESTARYVVHYTAGGHEHTQLWRSGGPASPSAMETFLAILWSDVSPMLFEAIITDVVFYPDGIVVGNSVAMPSFVGNSYGTGNPSDNLESLFINFVARSSGGRRVRASFYSPIGTDSSWRFYTTEETEVAAAFATLTANSDLVGIDGTPLTWKPYANNGYNAYWQRKTRS